MVVSPFVGLEEPVESLRGGGAKRGAALREAGISTVGDLLYRLPRRYLDRSTILSIAEATAGIEATLLGTVEKVGYIPRSGGRVNVTLVDGTGAMSLVWFRGGRYMRNTFKQGDQLAVSGKIDAYKGGLQLIHPEYEFIGAVDEESRLLHTGSIVPLYTGSSELQERGLRNRSFRRLIAEGLERCGEGVSAPLSDELKSRLGLPGLAECLHRVHFPDTLEQVERCRRRLAFDELYAMQLALLQRRRQRLLEGRGIAFSPSDRLVPGLRATLRFSLTAAQERVITEIQEDMGSSANMVRLLQGDVGSGKTLVALFALLTAVENGFQAAMMVPTEVLAEQHFRSIQALVEDQGVKIVALTGAQPAAVRAEIQQAVSNGTAELIVGTHALIQQGVDFARLGLVVIDEQHRFGVGQRSSLWRKGECPDVLTMTATPIPRTLALTRYGDQDLSVLDELPVGRRPVRTGVRSPARRDRVLEFAGEQMRDGRQVYVVYPVIDESESTDLTSAITGFEDLTHRFAEAQIVELLHGRMSTEEKRAVMARFAKGDIHMLVTTTVIEVGVDVPNATVMIVEHAERFGLAQLHQLRGRVGRGADQSYCILMSDSAPAAQTGAAQRLQVLCDSEDGFRIAQRDLELRGPGELLGIRQAGLPELVVADLVRQDGLVELARREAAAAVAAEHGEAGSGAAQAAAG